MNYFFTDFYALSAIKPKNPATAEDILAAMSVAMNYPVELPCLASALSALAADGYITVEGSLITASTRVTLSDKGEAALAVGGMAKLFKKARYAAEHRNRKAFCALPRPSAKPLDCDAESFATTLARLQRDYGDMRLWQIGADGTGVYTVSFCRPFTEEDGESDPDAAVSDGCAVTVDLSTLQRTVGDLLDTAVLLTESKRSRKVCLSGQGRAYVLTFAYVTDETGEPVLRLSASPILFNRQRFIGKRDSDLDYAQCGDNVLTATFYNAPEVAGLLLAGAVMHPTLLTEEAGEHIQKLCRNI